MIESPGILLTVLAFALVIGPLVFLHELGHYLAGRWFGVKAEEFSIGFGREIAGITDKRGTRWKFGWLPLGGYVRFAGDMNPASQPSPEWLSLPAQERAKTFQAKPLWQRAIIVGAGPFANFLLSTLVFATLLFAFGMPVSSTRVDTVVAGSRAEQAGFRPGDVILKVDGKAVDGFDDITSKVVLSSETPMTFVVQRGSEEVALTATPARGPIVDRLGKTHMMGKLGLGHQNQPGDVLVRRYNLPEAIAGGAERTVSTISTTLTYLGRLFSGRESADQLAGPLGMAQMSGDLTKQAKDVSSDTGAFVANTLLMMFEFIGIISVSIGFMNLLPVPVLDGGHLMFYAYEAVTRRPLAAKVQAAGYRVGLALVLGLMLFATWNDLQRLRVFNLFGDLFS